MKTPHLSSEEENDLRLKRLQQIIESEEKLAALEELVRISEELGLYEKEFEVK